MATSVAAQLGISTQAAQQRLTQAFSGALAPNDTGPPGTTAERAAALVARFRQIAELATRVTNGDQGQPIRQIAGNSSDAVTAKANPAPDPDSILRDAQQALAATTSPAPQAAGAPVAAPGAAATTAAPAAGVIAAANAGDGRTVAFAPLEALASGGDTLLGRTLARAALADSSSSAPVATPIEGPHHLTGAAAPTVQQSLGAPVAANAPAEAAVEAFVSAFAGALARSDGAGSDRHAGDAPSPTPVVTTAQTPSAAATTAQPIASFAVSTAHDAVSIAPPAPPQTLPQPQHVDANAVVDQILRGMTIRTTDGQSEVRMRLVPEQLGDVSVKLVVSGGSVDASITAHTVDAQSALAGAQTQLAKSLADAGLKLQSFSVGLAGGFADPRDQSRSNDQSVPAAARRIGTVEPAEPDASPDPSLLAIPSFGPPIYAANSALGALNYLV